MLDHATIFQAQRSHLFAIAYRMLGQVMDAEDMVQETFLRWRRSDLLAIENPKAFLTTLITRLSIDFLRSARVKRESYIGPWLPEPVLTSQLPAVGDTVAQRESVSVAFLFLLETLRPTERAAFLLREVFDYDYNEIADILEKSPANCRQIVSRARRRLTTTQPDWSLQVSSQQETHLQLIEQFIQACLSGDVASLQAILHEDAILWSDGGGKVLAARKPIHGAAKIAQFMINLRRFAPADLSIRLSSTNGLPAVLLFDGQKPISVITFAARGEMITQFQNILNPEKLQGIPGLDEL